LQIKHFCIYSRVITKAYLLAKVSATIYYLYHAYFFYDIGECFNKLNPFELSAAAAASIHWLPRTGVASLPLEYPAFGGAAASFAGFKHWSLVSV
jgi:hypothetical protein